MTNVTETMVQAAARVICDDAYGQGTFDRLSVLGGDEHTREVYMKLAREALTTALLWGEMEKTR